MALPPVNGFPPARPPSPIPTPRQPSPIREAIAAVAAGGRISSSPARPLGGPGSPGVRVIDRREEVQRVPFPGRVPGSPPQTATSVPPFRVPVGTRQPTGLASVHTPFPRDPAPLVRCDGRAPSPPPTSGASASGAVIPGSGRLMPLAQAPSHSQRDGRAPSPAPGSHPPRRAPS